VRFRVRAVWKEDPRRVIYVPAKAKSGLDFTLSARHSVSLSWEVTMLRWALGFFVVALIAALLGFGGIALAAAGVAKIIFYIFLVLFVVSLLGHLASRT
jgi:uncharacterized membrane protein YtjA (UPF0391 family)